MNSRCVVCNPLLVPLRALPPPTSGSPPGQLHCFPSWRAHWSSCLHAKEFHALSLIRQERKQRREERSKETCLRYNVGCNYVMGRLNLHCNRLESIQRCSTVYRSHFDQELDRKTLTKHQPGEWRLIGRGRRLPGDGITPNYKQVGLILTSIIYPYIYDINSLKPRFTVYFHTKFKTKSPNG